LLLPGDELLWLVTCDDAGIFDVVMSTSSVYWVHCGRNDPIPPTAP
jgi:cupin superfamily acireductone dioxygenase involved in methionine salvage